MSQHPFTLSHAALLLTTGAALSIPSLAARSASDACDQVAHNCHKACQAEVLTDFWTRRAGCSNLATPLEKAQCIADSYTEAIEEWQECDDRLDARLDLCAATGGGVYAPIIDPNNFVPLVDNPYFPLLPGTTWTHQAQTAKGLETVVVTVEPEVRIIQGVACTVVRDVVSLDGEVIEDTLDWFAQDTDGNVWYFGEAVKDFEDGELVSLDGSFEAGEDGAQAGIVMHANPQLGDVYRLEYLIREAEDAATILSTNETIVVAGRTFYNCLKTEDFTPLEPDVLEHKYYAPGWGPILTIDLATGERLELIDISTH